MGDLLGYDSGWKRAIAGASPIPASLVALEDGNAGDTISASAQAMVSGYSDLTSGGAVYLGSVAGGYADSPVAAFPQVVGLALGTDIALIQPQVAGVPTVLQHRYLMPPKMATANLPSPTGRDGALVWDTTAGCLKVAAGATWEIVAIVT